MKRKAKLTRSEMMSRVKGRDTSIEMKLRRALWKEGIRYRKNCKGILGTPDICLKGLKIAIFCDSEFWHGKLYMEGKSIPKNNREFWERKLERNIERDKEVNEGLENEGWTVLRFWDKEIEKDLDRCVDRVRDAISTARSRLFHDRHSEKSELKTESR